MASNGKDALAASANESQQVQYGFQVSDALSEAGVLLSQCLLKLQAVRILSWYFDYLIRDARRA